jgi:uncharacterized protein (TIGR00369 family)
VFVLDSRDDRLLAHGTSRLSILPKIDGPPEAPDDPPAHEPPAYETPDPFQRPAPEGTVIPQEVWSSASGLEVLERQLRGDLPSPAIHALTGLRPVEVGEGRATAVLPASEWLNSPTGRLQGGAIAMLADFAITVAVLTTAPAGMAIAGLDLKVNFLRPVVGDGRDLTARAQVEHSGRTLAISRATITDDDRRPVMLATGTTMHLPGRPASLDPGLELADSD